MQTLFERQMAMYAGFHRDARNRATHFIGIPAIVFSLILAAAMVRVPMTESLATLSLALPLTLGVWVLWVALDRRIGLAMGLFLVPSFVLAEYLARTLTADRVWIIFAVAFVGGWVFQLVGHVFEGKRPALMSNLFQALIGPMFLMAEIFDHFGRGGTSTRHN